MRKIAEIKSDKRLQILESGFDGMVCYLNDKRYRPPREMAIIASWCGGWEHVSVSLQNRCPTWDEMCRIKDIFLGRGRVRSSIPSASQRVRQQSPLLPAPLEENRRESRLAAERICMKPIVDRIGKPAMLEQTAEECAELAHACLKEARRLRGENPTPKTTPECWLAIS